jgi:RecA-family ATPase
MSLTQFDREQIRAEVRRDSERAMRLHAQESPARIGKGRTFEIPAPPTVELLQASKIKMEPISWLWPGWLAAGKLHILGGVPGTGKTTIALSLAAVISRGGEWPDGTKATARNVVIWSGEDDPADTIKPRLLAMGADLDRVHIVSGVTTQSGRRAFDPSTDMEALIVTARQVSDVGLLVVDPVVTAIAGDSHKNAEVRRGLAPLIVFAQELGAAVLGITHFSKGTSGKDPLDRLTGSLAFGAAPRLAFAASKKKDEDGEDTDARLFVRVKSNIGPDGGALLYTLAVVQLPNGIETSKVVWSGKIEGSARDILADAEQTEAQSNERTERDEAKGFLKDLLAKGPLKAPDVLRQAKDAGHSDSTIRRAKKELGIVVSKQGMHSGWAWQLPKMATESEDVHTKTVSTFESVDYLRDKEAF